MHVSHSFNPPKVLAIGGSDCSGGAGIQADLKTMTRLGVYGATVISCITAQNSKGVLSKHPVEPGVFRAQLDSIIEEIDFSCIKVGMLDNWECVEATAHAVSTKGLPTVLDPVIRSTSGLRLLSSEAEQLLKDKLIPQCSLITPNLIECSVLLGINKEQISRYPEQAAKHFFEHFSVPILLKGGHGSGTECIDIFYDGCILKQFKNIRVDTNNTHGTGCTLASAIASYFAHGNSMINSIEYAVRDLHKILCNSDALSVYSEGYGPVNHLAL